MYAAAATIARPPPSSLPESPASSDPASAAVEYQLACPICLTTSFKVQKSSARCACSLHAVGKGWGMLRRILSACIRTGLRKR